MSRRIHTFTANLLWETTYRAGSWMPGDTVRAESESVQVGGKGINVSRMLNRLGAANTAILFPAGTVGALCTEWLENHGLSTRTFEADGETRTGFVVRSQGMPETTFLGEDRPPNEVALRDCCDYLLEIPEGDALAVCGSIPGWAAPAFDPLRETLDRLIRKLFVAVDTCGPPLSWFAERPVGLVKINEREFQGIRPGDHTTLREIHRHRVSPRAWVVTDGKRNVKIIGPENEYFEKNPPPVQEVSPTGSGDVFLAAFLHARLNEGKSMVEAADEAIPLAAANCTSHGIADYPDELAGALKEEYRRLNN